MKTIRTLLMVFVCTGSFLGLHADERTGREFSELVKDLNNDLSTAKVKIAKLEEKRQAEKTVKQGKILPERGKALSELERLTEKLDDAEDPEEKKALAGQVENQVLEVAKLSADFLETQKKDLINQDEQLEVVEDALASVITKMNKLQKLAAEKISGGNTVDAETAKKQARKKLQNIARAVEVLAAKNSKSQRWKSIRQTIALQDAVLRQSTAANSRIHEMLASQKQVYEQVLAQISIARQGIQGEKELLAQVALGEVARSLLRKAAGLLLGNQSIENIGNAAILKSEQRQQNILAFLEQDNENGNVYSGLNNDSSEDYPAGYQEFLEKEIK